MRLIAGQVPGTNDGRAYVPLLRRGVKIVFLEYAPNMTWAWADPEKYQAIFGRGVPMGTKQELLGSYMTMTPDSHAGGQMLGRLFERERCVFQVLHAAFPNDLVLTFRRGIRTSCRPWRKVLAFPTGDKQFHK